MKLYSRHKPAQSRANTATILNSLIADLAPYLGGFADILSAETKNPKEFRLVMKAVRAYAEQYTCDDILFTAAVRQVSAIVEKLPEWGSLPVRERQSRAMETFHWSERRCSRYNKKLRYYRNHWNRVPKTIRRVLNSAIDRCHAALGPCDIDWSKCGWGPGVTFATGKLMGQKLLDQTVTRGAKQHALGVLKDQFPNWADYLVTSGSKLDVVNGDRISFAPKNSDIERVLGIQCSLNVFCQKAVEQALVDAAWSLGVTINDQTRNTQLLGRWKDVATIDLRAASECIARECVSLFFPSDWVQCFKDLSSPMYMRKEGNEEVWTSYNKLMPQGNCITFPMESILFNCVAFAATEYCGGDTSLVRTYGDDIIVPTNAALLTIEVLEWLGLKVNTGKTHVLGAFRETCGVDVLHGVDIRPVYMRKVPKSDPELADLYNRLSVNRVGFFLEKTLTYLHSLAAKPLYGPAYMAAGDSDLIFLEDGILSNWYAGKSSRSASFFWSPQPSHESVVCFTGKTPFEVRVLDAWAERPIRRLSGNDELDYLVFLLGRRGGYEDTGTKTVVKTIPLFGEWLCGDILFPDLYPDTRRVSARMLRRVTRAVIGAKIF